MRNLIEVRVFEPAESKGWSEPSLDKKFDHPDRYRVAKYWDNGNGTMTMVGGQHSWPMHGDGTCTTEWGEGVVLGEIDRERHMEPDRFELA